MRYIWYGAIGGILAMNGLDVINHPFWFFTVSIPFVISSHYGFDWIKSLRKKTDDPV